MVSALSQTENPQKTIPHLQYTQTSSGSKLDTINLIIDKCTSSHHKQTFLNFWLASNCQLIVNPNQACVVDLVVYFHLTIKSSSIIGIMSVYITYFIGNSSYTVMPPLHLPWWGLPSHILLVLLPSSLHCTPALSTSCPFTSPTLQLGLGLTAVVLGCLHGPKLLQTHPPFHWYSWIFEMVIGKEWEAGRGPWWSHH